MWPFSRQPSVESIRSDLLRELKEDVSLNQLIERIAEGQQSYSGESVNPANAMKCTTVHGIVRALTNAIGSYPVSVAQKTMTNGRFVTKTNTEHGVNRILMRPNAIHAPTEFYRMAMRHVTLWGNFYAIKGQASTGPIAFLRPIENPDAVALDDVLWGGVRMDGQEMPPGAVFKITLQGEPQRFVHSSKLLHITGGILSDDGVTGASPVDLARQAIGICLAAERLIAQLYNNNDIPSYAIKGAEFRDEQQYDLWMKKLRERYGPNGERGQPLALPPGMDIREMSFKPVDAQLLEMRKFQRIEIAQVYGVPPHKLADLERATFSNIEEQSLEFVRDVAKPYVRLFEQAMARDLITDSDRLAGYVVKFDMSEATEGKLVDRLDAYSKAHAVGAMNPNEIRARLDENPRPDPGGDEYVVAANMRTGNVSGSNQGESSGEDDQGEDAGSETPPVRAVR